MTDFQVPLVTSSNIIPLEKFWLSLFLYHDRPHLVNRRLAACQQILYCKVTPLNAKFTEIFTKHSLLYEHRKCGNEGVNLNFLKNIVSTHSVELEIVDEDLVKNSLSDVFVSLRLLFGRDSKKAVEVVVIDKCKNRAIFLAAQEENVFLAPPFMYQIELTKNGQLRILLQNFEDADTSSAVWLAEKLFLKLLNWQNFEKSNVLKSLTLIPTNSYFNTYNEIKSKYAPYLMANWPEKTDPKKFIHEELAIASYLICLWSTENKTNINFIDCGCGNGLLVYVLNKEGYKGSGIDLRRRKIWDNFSETTLTVDTIGPDSVFNECNWIIGNHSDELTPWVPIIALKSSPKTNFFVLPCCCYDFNGQKYKRINTNVSQYSDYIEYIKKISLKCGFETKIDKLRIPSTKRVCLVGLNNKCNIYTDDVRDFVQTKVGNSFKQRESVEKVRNCTKLPRNFLDEIVKKIVNILLKDENYINKHWNRGGLVKLGDLCRQLGDDTKMLKKECGGLQTLLKNHRYLFELKEGGVLLRLPPNISETQKYKEKKCWYFYNHPNGCLQQTNICGYSHNFSIK